MIKQINQVEEFHRKMNFTINHSPTAIDSKLWEYRMEMTEDELFEYFKETEFHKKVKELFDTLYLILGDIVALGLQGIAEQLFDELQKENMSKEPPIKEGKAIKNPDTFYESNFKKIIDDYLEEMEEAYGERLIAEYEDPGPDHKDYYDDR